MERVCAPPLLATETSSAPESICHGGGPNLPPDVPLPDEASPIASPVAPRPSGALVKELVAVFEGGLELALRTVLNPSLPLMADEPARDKVVVVGVQNPASPFFILESMHKIRTRQNLRPICSSPARHT